MNLTRWIAQHRPVAVLTVLVGLSLLSLLTGTQATIIHRALERVVATTAYPFLEAKQWAGSAVSYATDFVFRYDAIRDERNALEANVAKLKLGLAQRAELGRENERLRGMLAFLRNEPRLSLDPAQVIGNFRGMLTIDLGSAHGIEKTMCVLTPEGVVGIVTEVNPFTANVATLHHPDCKAGAMVMRNRLRAYDGVIHAGGGDINPICTMDYIDMKDDVRRNDRVVTSPESLFPAGYPIGTINAPPRGSGSLWKSAEIVPAVDLFRLDEVFVVRRALAAAEELAGPAVARELISMAPAAPDERPIQERYAP